MSSASMATHHDIVWEWLEEPGLEYVAVRETAEAIRATGYVVAGSDGLPWRLRYSMSCGAQWDFHAIEVAIDRAGACHALSLSRDDGGAWRANGLARPDLDGCTDIDMEASPLTNTLPIRRLAFAPDDPIAIDVAYIRLPSLDIVAAKQAYTRIDAASPPRRFRYQGLATGFTADLVVDEFGFVDDYPNLWRRLR